MIRVLLFGKNKKHFALVEEILVKQLEKPYEIAYHPKFRNEIFSDSYFDVVLILDERVDQIDLEIIKQIVHIEIPAPIILISANRDPKLDDMALHLGASDSIPLDELCPSLLERSIRHTIGRRNSAAKLSFLATHDQLTGLANRFLFHEHLTRTIGIAKRNHSTFGLLFLDLDRFKTINDSLGHDVGDLLLIEIAKRIRKAVRLTDVVARVGGDEFTVLLEDAKSKQELAMIAKKIQLAIEPLINVRNHDLYATTSIGIAYFPECGLEPQSLMKSADIALYKAKEMGRNNFQFFTNDLNEKTRLKLELEKHLRRALIKGEFEIYFQPQVSTVDHHVCGVEALLRWNHPTMGLVSPIAFIPLLEELGLMVSVEQWVIKQVCLIAKRITDLYGNLRFAINISGSHFKLGDLKQSIYLALQESSLDARHLEIELTEDIMIEHVERNNTILTELSDIGISIALDDFGKGYSSLSYLKNFPADVLKIDKAFIDNILSDGRESAIVEAMIDLSHKLGIKVVAEGVELKDQAKDLANKHCDFIQGYYFAKPMTLFDLESYLAKAFDRKAQ
ncbi:MAG: EAL domain-containing protein [Enterobacterales bacterium]|nr:EAL domain-containing protein [Enterobacterales bacterium]